MEYLIQQSQNHMATTFDFSVVCNGDQKQIALEVLACAHKRVAQLERELSEFLPESPIFRLNRSSVGEKILVNESVLALLDRSFYWQEVSRGSFSCLAKGEISERGALGWDWEPGVVWRNDLGAWVGFGAIGKGYALDRVRELLEQHGLLNYRLSAGGSSLIFSGLSLERSPWEFWWSWECDESGSPVGIPFRHLCGTAVAIGVSGNQERPGHLLDPSRRNCPKEHKSVLIGHTSATDADALSTATFLSGWEKSRNYFQETPTPPAMAVVDNNGEMRWNGVFQRLWGSAGQFASLLIFGVGSFSFADEVIDLGDLGLGAFNPYLFERSSLWILLPISILAFTYLHLKNHKKGKPDHESEKDADKDIQNPTLTRPFPKP